jgi:hypothetical protein
VGVKRPGREAESPAPYSVEVEMREAVPSFPPFVSMLWSLIKHRDNFSLHIKHQNLYDYGEFVTYESQSSFHMS